MTLQDSPETGEQFDIENLFAEPRDDEELVKERKDQAEIDIDSNDIKDV